MNKMKLCAIGFLTLFALLVTAVPVEARCSTHIGLNISGLFNLMPRCHERVYVQPYSPCYHPVPPPCCYQPIHHRHRPVVIYSPHPVHYQQPQVIEHYYY